MAALVDGLNRFQMSLAQIAADSAATGSQHVYQRGFLIGSMADVSDGGGLARYELNQADGLPTIREAFERLRELGVGPRDSHGRSGLTHQGGMFREERLYRRREPIDVGRLER